MNNPYQIVLRPMMTEKGVHRARKQNTYYFEVHPGANKSEIAKAVEAIYSHKKVQVIKVNTLRYQGKWRRVRNRQGTTAQSKRALVTLRAGDVLDLI